MAKKKRSSYADYCEVRNGKLYANIFIPLGNGKYKRKRKRVASRTEARQWAQEQLIRKPDGFDSFADLVNWYKSTYLFEPEYENGIKIAGVKSYRQSKAVLERLADEFGDMPLSAFDEALFLRYARRRRKEDKITTATLNRTFALLRTMFRRAHNIAPHIIIPKFPINTAAEVERDRILSREEEQRLLAQCVDHEEVTVKGDRVRERNYVQRSHLRPIVIMALDTAMRVGEILSLTWDDIDLENRLISIKAMNTKTQRKRTVGITTRLYNELKALPKGADKVFGRTTVKRSFMTACKRAKIKGLRFHDLRHTATTRMINAGIPHTEVMKITGHRQMKTFMRYLNVQSDAIQNNASKLDAYLDAV